MTTTKNLVKQVLMSTLTAVALTTVFASCDNEDDVLSDIKDNTRTETRGASGWLSFIERRWNGSEVESVIRLKGDYTEISGYNCHEIIRMEADKYYVIKGNCTRLAFYAPTKGEGHLILGDGSALNARINIDEGQTLNIYSQENGTGKLEAKSNSYMSENPGSSEGSVMAAIGSRMAMGTLVIHGGNIKADSSNDSYSSGIGGGRCGDGGNVTIYGGTVKAYGGKDAAGIGSGEQKTTHKVGGRLTVYGGTVEARGGAHGAGIGGGQDASGAIVAIHGGTVRAYGGMDAAGIGSGERCTASSSVTHGGELTVTGGDVFADGTGWGAGIGGGEDAKGAKVVITGGKVVAWAGEDAGKKNGSAIGSEDGDGRRGSLKLGDNMRVHAGQHPSDAQNNLFPFATRVPACFFRPYACIEVGASK